MTTEGRRRRRSARSSDRPPAPWFWAALVAALAVAAGCGPKEQKKSATVAPVLVTVVKASPTALEITEDTIGTLEPVVDPKVGSEVAGRITKVYTRAGQRVRKGQLLALIDDTEVAIQQRADAADVRRLEALLEQQDRLVRRQENLVQRGFISQNALDDAIAQRSALREQLVAARARVEVGRNTLAKTRIVSPVDGTVEVQIVATGDYVKVGDPIVRMVSNQRMRAHLPYPESAASRMKPGLPVRLTSPQEPGHVIQGTVDDIRPSLTEVSRAVDVIVRFDNVPGFLAGGTVDAKVVVARKDAAIVVPETSVVTRPAGKVVYVVAEGRARARPVQTGAKQGGTAEITSGLSGGESVVLDGAGFLTDNATVTVVEPGGAPASAQQPASASEPAS
jgi:RND family efflux transporter MFP subunit